MEKIRQNVWSILFYYVKVFNYEGVYLRQIGGEGNR